MNSITKQQLLSLVEITKQAGAAIMEIYARPDFEMQIKGDNSPLTEADLAADKIIRTALEAQFSDVFILSEESRSADSENVETFFLVDPLDGTKEFIKPNGEFTVNIPLVHKGNVISGVVFAPALGELFYGAEGLGVWKDETPIKVAPSADNQPLRVVGSRSHGAEEMEKWLAKLDREYSFTPAGSSLKLCRVAEGSADVYPRFGLTSQWDTAAAQGVLELAGGSVKDLKGNKLMYGLEREILNPFFIASAK